MLRFSLHLIAWSLVLGFALALFEPKTKEPVLQSGGGGSAGGFVWFKAGE